MPCSEKWKRVTCCTSLALHGYPWPSIMRKSLAFSFQFSNPNSFHNLQTLTLFKHTTLNHEALSLFRWTLSCPWLRFAPCWQCSQHAQGRLRSLSFAAPRSYRRGFPCVSSNLAFSFAISDTSPLVRFATSLDTLI